MHPGVLSLFGVHASARAVRLRYFFLSQLSQTSGVKLLLLHAAICKFIGNSARASRDGNPEPSAEK